MKKGNRTLKLIFIGMALILLIWIGVQYQKFSEFKSVQVAKIEERSTVVETSQGPIEFAVSGDGEPVLMIHGAGGGYDQGLMLAERFFPQETMTIAVSRFGYLNTPLGDDPTPDHQAALYVALLDELGISAVHVVGVSDGGPSALKMSIQYPDRVKSLTMIAAKSQTPPPLTAAQSIAFKSIFNNDFVFWSITQFAEADLYSVLGVSKEVQSRLTAEEKEMAKAFLELMHPISLRKDGIFNANVQFAELSPEDYPLWKIKAPTLVIHAKDDTLQPYSYAEYTHETVPNAELLGFESGGHMLFGHHGEIQEALADHFRTDKE